MAEVTNEANASQDQAQKGKGKAQEPERRENTRVSKKIDLNTVEIEFGKDAKPGSKFLILDKGAIHGEVTFDGEELTKVVRLENFLPRGSLHNFSVELK